MTNQHNYAVLAEIDWTSKKVIRSIKFPSAAFKTQSAFMAPLIGGVCTIENRVFVAMWNYLIEIDYHTFEIVNTISHPWMTDLHGITTNDEYIWVASTAIDSILCLDVKALTVVDRWGPDEPILYTDRLGFFDKLLSKKITFDDIDYRHIHKSTSPYHYHHINDVYYHDNNLYITAKQWNNGKATSPIIKLDLENNQVDFFASPGSFVGAHDGLYIEDNFFVTESGTNSIGICHKDGQITHHKVQPDGYFVRGLATNYQSLFIGFSTLRNSNQPALLVEYDTKVQEPLSSMRIDQFYPDNKNTAVHAISVSPDKG